MAHSLRVSRKAKWLLAQAFLMPLYLVALTMQTHAYAASAVTCTGLTMAESADKNYYVLTATAAGDVQAISGYTFTFGDHQSYTVNYKSSNTTPHGTATVTHTYQNVGSYKVAVSITTKDGRKTQKFSAPSCQTSVVIAPAVSSMPNAGAGNTFGLFVGVCAVGALAHHLRFRHTVFITKEKTPLS